MRKINVQYQDGSEHDFDVSVGGIKELAKDFPMVMDIAYSTYTMEETVAAILDYLNGHHLSAYLSDDFSEDLNKSEDGDDNEKLSRGWTGEVPKIEIDFDNLLESTMSKYLKALKYILLGDLAGKDAKDAAKQLDLPKKIIPGIVQSAYLDSIDTQREYGEKLTGEEPRTIPRALISESMLHIQRRTERFIDESLDKLKNRLIVATELEAQKINEQNIQAVRESEDTEETIIKRNLKKALSDVTESHKTDWKRLVAADVQIASAAGTHQAIQEIYGGESNDVKVAWVAMRDEKTCQFCRNASRHPDGSFKIYKMSDFMPAGYNYSKKKNDWKLCIPGAHPNCRCTLAYIPAGFQISKDGTVAPKK